MYKPIDKLQYSFLGFNQPMGLHMNPDNRWVKMADRIPRDDFVRKTDSHTKFVRLGMQQSGTLYLPHTGVLAYQWNLPLKAFMPGYGQNRSHTAMPAP